MSLDDAFDADDEWEDGGYPDTWKPEEPGDELLGHVTDIREDPFGDDNTVFDVETEDGTTFTTNTNVRMVDLVEQSDADIGDIVQIRFDGSETTKNNNDIKLYKMRSRSP